MKLIRASAKAVKNSLISKHFQNNTPKCPKVDQAHDYKVPPQPGSICTDKAIRDIFKPETKDRRFIQAFNSAPCTRRSNFGEQAEVLFWHSIENSSCSASETYGDSSNRVEFISQNREVSVILEINNIRFGWLAKIKATCRIIYLLKYNNA